MLGKIIRPLIAVGLIGVGFSFIKSGNWIGWVLGIICFVSSAVLFWAIVTGKFADKSGDKDKK